MQAIILAGGLGTRLQSVLNDLPKPMAPLQQKPFLAYLIEYLEAQGINEVYLSVYHLHEKISAYFQHRYNNVAIHYVIEDELLGTGGAICNVLKVINKKGGLNLPIFVLNGDTFVKLNYREMFAAHLSSAATLTVALRSEQDCMRYGKAEVANQKILNFREKGETGSGLINAGVYLLNEDLFLSYALPLIFSFENDFLGKFIAEISPAYFLAQDYFIDIGIPADYERAQREIPRECSNG